MQGLQSAKCASNSSRSAWDKSPATYRSGAPRLTAALWSIKLASTRIVKTDERIVTEPAGVSDRRSYPPPLGVCGTRSRSFLIFIAELAVCWLSRLRHEYGLALCYKSPVKRVKPKGSPAGRAQSKLSRRREKMASIKKTMLLIAGQALWATGLFAAQPTVQDAKKFLDDAEQRLLVLANEAQQASWVQENFITSDTESLAALANQRATDEQVRLAKDSKRFDALTLPPDLARKMRLLRIGFTLATPADPKESEEVSRLAAELDGMYGKGKYCPPALASSDKKCLDITDITRIMACEFQSGRVVGRLEGLARDCAAHAKGFHAFCRALE